MENKIDALLQSMTLEEKIGQMNQYNGFWEVTGPAPNEGQAKAKYDHLKKGWVGAVLNVKGAEEVRKMQELVVNESRLGIPLLFGYDVIHGHMTLSPIPLAEAASWDLEAIEQSARVAAIEASAVGINWTFAPMVDISRDPRWGRVMEGAGEDPFLGTAIGLARVKGFQGEQLDRRDTIAATLKHFAGYGFVEGGRDYNTVDVGTTTLHNVILPPFKAAVEQGGVQTFMNSFNILNGVPATGDTFLQREILKDKWGFDGFIVSDWSSAQEMIAHGFAKDLKHAAALAANSGSDMDMESYAFIGHLKELVEEGTVSMEVIDDAVRRILRVKFRLGLFDDPYKYCDSNREKALIYHPDHQAAALDIAKKSIVLLKNENQLLPLQPEQEGIAVIGELASDKNSPLGSWRIGSEDNTAISVLEGIDQVSPNYTYAKGVDLITGPTSFLHPVPLNTTDRTGIAEAVEIARNAKVVVMVLGEHGFQSGEARSRADISLPGLQSELLQAVYAVNKHIILVLMSGRPLTIPWEAEHIPAILQTWQLGSQSGNAIAEVLFGKYNPGGKLPMTFPRSVGQIPIYYNYFNTGRPVPKGDVFWSHYSDEENSPLFPFGFGLSYTQFSYSELEIDSSNRKAIQVRVKVTNTGPRSGEEVTQLYIRDKVGSIVRPVKELKGFQKNAFEAGESKTVSFILTEKELGFYDAQGNFLVESGDFDIMVGTNSQEGLSGSFTLY